MGSRTYEHALELLKSYGWAYGEVPTIVVTHRNLPVERKNITIYSGDLNKHINELQPNYKNVWVVGGAMLARDFIRLKLADQISLSILPIILGDGTLFLDYIAGTGITLKRCDSLQSGMVELRYEIKKE